MENRLEGHETGDRETDRLGAIAVVQGRVDEGLKGTLKQLSSGFNQCRV